ncbi:uncharacterized protein DAT39_018752, partial [Clarias magur]
GESTQEAMGQEKEEVMSGPIQRKVMSLRKARSEPSLCHPSPSPFPLTPLDRKPSRDFEPSDAQEQLLNKGLTFIPTPRVTNLGELGGDVHAYNRQLKILDYFQYNNRTQQ